MVGSANDSDRVHRSHQTWFHFVKSPRYFAAVDEIREPQLNTGGGRGNYDTSASAAMRGTGMPKHSSLAMTNGNPLGKLPGSVWTIPYDTDLPEGDSPPMHNLGTAQIIQGNALNLPLPDASVDLICTSPPYFGLRSYQDSCQTCGGVDQSGPKMSGPSANSTLTGSKANRSGTDRDGQTPDPACTDCGGTGKGHYDGQIGSEATPAEFLDALLAATREMVRVLKPSGSIFVNLGDKYSTGNSGDSGMAKLGEQYRGGGHTQAKAKTRTPAVAGMRPKSLLGLPWRYAIACIDQLGLILRAEIIWSKPNGLPESVTDRVRRSHEQWFHFTKSPRYFSAVDEIREPSGPETWGPNTHAPGRIGGTKPREEVKKGDRRTRFEMPNGMDGRNPLGKLPGSVWTIPTQPLSVPPELGVDHFAAYPMEWPRRIILGWTPNGICTGCGFLLGSSYDSGMLGVRKEFQRTRAQREASEVLQQDVCESPQRQNSSLHQGMGPDIEGLYLSEGTGSSDVGSNGLRHGAPSDRVRGYGPGSAAFGSSSPPEWSEGRQQAREPRTPSEDRSRQTVGGDTALQDHLSSLRSRGAVPRICPHCSSTEIGQSVVVDVFGGTGTTALVAKALGRTGITIDLSSDYCRLAEWRCNDPRELAAALQVEKPEVVHPDQLDLFSES